LPIGNSVLKWTLCILLFVFDQVQLGFSWSVLIFSLSTRDLES
jgi:hypothetical protein